MILKFNSYLQSVIVVIAIGMSLLLFVDDELIFTLAVFQLFVGILQYVQSLLFVIFAKTRNRYGIIHLIASTIFLFIYATSEDTELWGMLIPWGLAVLFWYASWDLYRRQ